MVALTAFCTKSCRLLAVFADEIRLLGEHPEGQKSWPLLERHQHTAESRRIAPFRWPSFLNTGETPTKKTPQFLVMQWSYMESLFQELGPWSNLAFRIRNSGGGLKEPVAKSQNTFKKKTSWFLTLDFRYFSIHNLAWFTSGLMLPSHFPREPRILAQTIVADRPAARGAQRELL
jgi:hypothetical protein